VLDMVFFMPGYRHRFACFVTKKSIFYFIVAIVPVLRIRLIIRTVTVFKIFSVLLTVSNSSWPKNALDDTTLTICIPYVPW